MEAGQEDAAGSGGSGFSHVKQCKFSGGFLVPQIRHTIFSYTVFNKIKTWYQHRLLRYSGHDSKFKGSHRSPD